MPCKSNVSNGDTEKKDQQLTNSSPKSTPKQNHPEEQENGEHPVKSLPGSVKKRVSFGVNLSPEYFDKVLPPSSPLSLGASPKTGHNRRKSTPLFSQVMRTQRKTRMSLGAASGGIQGGIEEEAKDEGEQPLVDVNDLFSESPSMKNLPPPMIASAVSPVEDDQQISDGDGLQETSSPKNVEVVLTELADENLNEMMGTHTPGRKRKLLATPLRRAIHAMKPLRRSLRKSLPTPTRDDIKQGKLFIIGS